MYRLLIIAVLISILASINVKRTFNKYSKSMNTTGWNGAALACWMLNLCGINDVKIEHIKGHLTDHYDPTTKTLRLSDEVYNKCSMADIGVAAHECGHAIQHATNYGPLVARSKMVPIANLGSKLSEILIIFGIIFSATGLIDVGVLLFSAVVAFYLVTLPVEFNASRRACGVLAESGYFTDNELSAVKYVLSAAAMTYAVSALVAALQLIRLIGLRRD